MSEFKSMGQTEAVQRQIPFELQELGKITERLDKVIAELDQVLTPVMSKNSPPDSRAKELSNEKELGTLCDTARQIHNRMDQVTMATLALEDLINQVEL